MRLHAIFLPWTQNNISHHFVFRCIDRGSREYFTSVEKYWLYSTFCISGVRNNHLNGDVLIKKTMTLCWNRSSILPITQNKTKGVMHRFFLSSREGCCSHMTIPFHNLAAHNEAVLIRLPSLSKHLTQPFDVGGFQPWRNNAGKKREGEDQRAGKQANSQLANFLLEQPLL